MGGRIRPDAARKTPPVLFPVPVYQMPPSSLPLLPLLLILALPSALPLPRIEKEDIEELPAVLKRCQPLTLARLPSRMQAVCQDLLEALEHFEAILEKVERDLEAERIYKRGYQYKRREPDHIFLRFGRG